MSVFDDLCRLCAHNLVNTEAADIFGPENGHVLSLIKLNFPITIDEDDLFPKKICMNCFGILNDVFELRDKSAVAVGIFNKTLLLIENSENGHDEDQEKRSLNDLCRLCALDLSTCEKTDLFFMENSHILSTLMINIPIEEQKIDNYPRNICNDCVEKLTCLFELRQKCLTSVKVFEKTSTIKRENYCPDLSENDPLVIKEEMLSDTEVYDEPETKYATADSVPKLMVCGYCYQNFKHEEDIKSHIYGCKQASESNKSTFYEKPTRPCLCKQCGKRFHTEKSLTKHQRIHLTQKPFPCLECGKSFVCKAYLADHQCRHTGETPFPCLECGKSFSSKALLSKHIRIHSGEKPFSCTECEKTFGGKALLVVHNRIHTGEKPLQCMGCSKSFRMKKDLSRHQRVHTDEKPFQCLDCGRKFSLKGTLANHLRTHSGVSSFQCIECGKSFLTKSQLTNHQLKHSGEKPFLCLECGKSFSLKATFTNHLRRHLSDEPYRCDDCGQSFSKKLGIINHVLKHAKKWKNLRRRQLLCLKRTTGEQVCHARC